MFARRRNRLTTDFSQRIPVVKRRISVHKKRRIKESTRLFIRPWNMNNTATDLKVCFVLDEEQKTNLMSLAILFHFLCAQHISDINISIIRSLRLLCWITTLVVLLLFRCMLELYPCYRLKLLFSLQHGYHSNPTTPKLQHRTNQEQYNQCGNSTE